jgi:hypothetical protein
VGWGPWKGDGREGLEVATGVEHTFKTRTDNSGHICRNLLGVAQLRTNGDFSNGIKSPREGPSEFYMFTLE